VKPPFLLQFQEDCIRDVGRILAGTQTLTFVNAEQIDSDPTHFQSGNVFPTEILLAGTATTTNVNAEGVDQDPNQGDRSVFPW
jgi:hypothetical protein